MFCLVMCLVNKVVDSTVIILIIGLVDIFLYLLFSCPRSNRSKKKRVFLLIFFVLISSVFDVWGYFSFFPKGEYSNPGIGVIGRVILYIGSLVLGGLLFSIFNYLKQAIAANHHHK